MTKETFTGYIDWDNREVYVDFGKGEPETLFIHYDIEEMARQVIAGYWGNGEERVQRLLGAGYTDEQISAIQDCVNKMMGY